MHFLYLLVKPRLWSRRKYSTNSNFSNANYTRSNNTTATSAHVKKESNSTLKYAAPATPTQQYSYKQGREVGVPESHVLETSRFLDFVELGIEILIDLKTLL